MSLNAGLPLPRGRCWGEGFPAPARVQSAACRGWTRRLWFRSKGAAQRWASPHSWWPNI